MSIKNKIENWVKETLKLEMVVLTHPKDLDNGDYAFFNHSPKMGNDLLEILNKNKLKEINKIEVAGNFVNIYLSKEFFAESVKEVLEKKESYGENDRLATKKIMIEFTDPNPFKEFHIGHMMSNAIGESISKLVEFSGAELKKANYQGNVGLHVAKTIWGKMRKPELSWGEAYAYGAKNYEQHKEEINNLNKIIYEAKSEEINKIYNEGLTETLKVFEKIYGKLGMEPRYIPGDGQMYFDNYFFESESAVKGKEIVEEFLAKGIFEESEGAIIFRGEKYNPKLHTRVFINSLGLPTYEAKELGLLELKAEHLIKGTWGQTPNLSIVITGNEIENYFKVVMCAAEQIGGDIKELAGKTKHLPHGMLRLPSGKMSSRTGEVITAESLIEQVKEKIKQKIDGSSIEPEQADKIAEIIAIGAIKFSILRQAIGGDIIFDFNKSISFEGDSSPYLQYTAVRAKSVLEKSKISLGLTSGNFPRSDLWKTTELERYLYRFPEIVERATREYAPHHLVTYLLELAAAFNSFYAKEKIINESDPASTYKIALTQAVFIVLQNGLRLLGIKVPERM